MCRAHLNLTIACKIVTKMSSWLISDANERQWLTTSYDPVIVKEQNGSGKKMPFLGLHFADQTVGTPLQSAKTIDALAR